MARITMFSNYAVRTRPSLAKYQYRPKNGGQRFAAWFWWHEWPPAFRQRFFVFDDMIPIGRTIKEYPHFCWDSVDGNDKEQCVLAGAP